MDDLVVAIRENGERTSELCRLIIAKQVPDENIFVIRQKPFYKALEETLRLCQGPQRWLIAVDADVLLYPDAIDKMLMAASAIRKEFFFYQGAVLDKFFLGYRPAGPHLYNCKHAEKAMSLKSGFEHDIRPETYVRTRMEEAGLAFVQDKTVYGVHDFEQYYADIYQKVFRHGLKHGDFMKNLNRLYCQFGQLDADFKVASRASSDALNGTAAFTDDLESAAIKALTDLGITEKTRLNQPDNSTIFPATRIKEDFIDTLQIDESFLAKQRYFPRYRPLINRFLDQWPFKSS